MHGYGGPHNANREFIGSDGKSSVILNPITGWDAVSGQPILEKDITRIERPNIVISIKKENDYMKQAARESDAAILQGMGQNQDPTNLEIRAAFENRLLLNSDFVDQAARDKAEKAVARREQLVEAQMDSMIASAMIGKIKAEEKLANTQKAAQGGQQTPEIPDGMKPPGLNIAYADLPPKGKVQAAAQHGIQLTEEDVAGLPATPPSSQPGQGTPGGQQAPVAPILMDQSQAQQSMQK
jgi:hypothetical protein